MPDSPDTYYALILFSGNEHRDGALRAAVADILAKAPPGADLKIVVRKPTLEERAREAAGLLAK